MFYKKFILSLLVFTLSFIVGYKVLSWTEPGSSPPSGNVSEPVNIGTKLQQKEGGFGATSLYTTDITVYNNANVRGTLYNEIGTLTLNDAVQVAGNNNLSVTGNVTVSGTGTSSFAGKVGIGTTSVGSEALKVQGDVVITGNLTTGAGIGKGTFTSVVYVPGSAPVGPTEGQIYWNSNAKKLYIYNGTSWSAITGTSEVSFCADYPGMPDDANCGTIDCSIWYVKTGTQGPNDTEYCYNKQDITTNRCEAVGDCKDANTADCTSKSNDALQYSCGSCKYISASSCTGATLGSCTNYADTTACTAVSGGQCYSGTCYKVVLNSFSNKSCTTVCSESSLTCAGIGTTTSGINNASLFYGGVADASCTTAATANNGDCSSTMYSCQVSGSAGQDQWGNTYYYYGKSEAYCYCH